MKAERFQGNEKAVELLNNRIASKDFTHSYLFSGIEGIGKYTLAKSFARSILTGREDVGDLGEVDLFEHPDLKIVDSEGSIKKAQIEEIIEEAAMTPFEAPYKVFLINDFHKVTPEGQNALLKTLEESSKYVKLILISSKEESIIPTIVSRCRVVKFHPLKDELIDEFLERRGIEVQSTGVFKGLYNGSISLALKYNSDSEYISLRVKSLDILDNLIKSRGYYPLKVYPFFEENKDNIRFILGNYLTWFRDLVLFLNNVDTDYIVNKDKLELLKSHSFIGLKRTLSIVDTIQESLRDFDYNVNFQLAVEALLLYIQEEAHD